MSKFNVGDRVEVVVEEPNSSYFQKGAVGTVVQLDTDNTVRVNFTSGDFDTVTNAGTGGLWVLDYKLALVKPYSASFTQQTSCVGFGDFLVEGHTSDGGGLQKHSVGNTYPWLVVGYGKHEEVVYCLQNLQNGTTLVSSGTDVDDFYHVRQWHSVQLAYSFLNRYLNGTVVNYMPIEVKGKPVFTMHGLIIKA